MVLIKIKKQAFALTIQKKHCFFLSTPLRKTGFFQSKLFSSKSGKVEELLKIDFENFPKERIRNFCITSHIDHGKVKTLVFHLFIAVHCLETKSAKKLALARPLSAPNFSRWQARWK